MEPFPNIDRLVSSAWLARELSPGWKYRDTAQDFMLFEAGSRGRAAYHSGHIPGAFFLDLSLLEKPPLWNLIPPEEIEPVLVSLGITFGSLAVLYSKEAFAAARAALILMVAGVEDVRLLDGGYQDWLSNGNPIETGANLPQPAGAFGTYLPTHPEYLLDIHQAAALLRDPDGRLACVRTWEEYSGKTSGYDYIEKGGHIPGSIWAGSIGSPSLGCPNGTMIGLPKIAAGWKEKGLAPHQKIGFYCGTGWRASEAFFIARLMGWENVGVYDGGWLEWTAMGGAVAIAGDEPLAA
jgi:thiosulfate/3-mercaptopyruvate sulfurtransferase